MLLKEKTKMFREVVEGLNETQRQAVLSNSKMLQILAGPGSGKTRVLPRNVVVVTFTNKAAEEMRKRLHTLLGEKATKDLIIGTFHAICARLLRQHSKAVGLDPKFTIADTDMSKDIIKDLLKDKNLPISDKMRKGMQPGAAYGTFSKAKSEGMTVHDYNDAYHAEKPDMCILFSAYEDKLRELNLVDFDNLLLKARELLEKKKTALAHVQAVLVDEYQDTNVVQYDLVKLMTTQYGQKDRCVTTVGDPDQSIFGWRSADPKNFLKMQEDFEETKQINMEQNYRSSGAILKSAFHVISQDLGRIEKSLYTNNPDGVPIALLEPKDEDDQVRLITQEIRKIVKLSKGLIEYKDIAVLYRMNYISRQFETTFRRNHIPYSIVGGDRFFDRVEVKDILGYLRFAYNPKDHLAFTRIINVPKRKIGAKTLEKLLDFQKQDGGDYLDIINKVCYGRGGAVAGFTPAVRTKLKDFIEVINHTSTMIKDQAEICEILEYIVEAINYKEHLKETYSKQSEDVEARMANIGELITLSKKNLNMDDDEDYVPMTQSQSQFNDDDDNGINLGNYNNDLDDIETITVVAADSSDDEFVGAPDIGVRSGDEDEDMIDLTNAGRSKHQTASSGMKQGKKGNGPSTETLDSNREDTAEVVLDPIAEFLEYCQLCSNQKELEAAEGGKVTLATMHSSKGLEWPVVFVVSCVDGVIPMTTNDDPYEECRLFYVAMTRSKFFLYCVSPQRQQKWGRIVNTDTSRFLNGMDNALFRRCVPDVNNEVRTMLAETLGKPLPEADDTLFRKSHEHPKGGKKKYNAYHEYYDPYGNEWDDDLVDSDEEYFNQYEKYANNPKINTQSSSNSNIKSIAPSYSGFQPASSLIRQPKAITHAQQKVKGQDTNVAPKQIQCKSPANNSNGASPKTPTPLLTRIASYNNGSLYLPKKSTEIDEKKRTAPEVKTTLVKRNKM